VIVSDSQPRIGSNPTWATIEAGPSAPSLVLTSASDTRHLARNMYGGMSIQAPDGSAPKLMAAAYRRTNPGAAPFGRAPRQWARQYLSAHAGATRDSLRMDVVTSR